MVLLYYHGLLETGLSVRTFWFHNMVTYTLWLVSTDFVTWSYQCSLSNFTPISLHMFKCSWAHYLSCLFMYGSFVNTGRTDMNCSSVSSNCLQSLLCYLFLFVIFLPHLVCNVWSCAAIISLSLSSPPNVFTFSWWGGLACLNDLTVYDGGNLCSWQGLPSRTGRKREARPRETNWSSKNGDFADGLLTLPRKIKVLISKDA